MTKKIDFALEGTNGKVNKLKDFAAGGKKLLLYFYPKDNTPGCSLESRSFSCLKDEFAKIGVEVVGVSGDSIESHHDFITKKDLSVLLLSDPDKKLANEIGAFDKKSLYGKIFKGLIRSTFLINPKTGEVEKEWLNVRAKGHAERVLSELKGE